MPDTGAPWNIPYVESTDLVSDWPADSLALANAIDAGLDAANVGIGSNVVQTVKTDTFGTSSSTYVDVTGLTVTITPTAATSKVLVFYSVMYSQSGTADGSNLVLVRDSTAVYIADDVANSNSNRTQINTSTVRMFSGVFLDSPATASAVTYKLQASAVNGTMYLNRRGDNSTAVAVSQITAIEVAA